MGSAPKTPAPPPPPAPPAVAADPSAMQTQGSAQRKTRLKAAKSKNMENSVLAGETGGFTPVSRGGKSVLG